MARSYRFLQALLTSIDIILKEMGSLKNVKQKRDGIESEF